MRLNSSCFFLAIALCAVVGGVCRACETAGVVLVDPKADALGWASAINIETCLFARAAEVGTLNLLHDLTEVVAFGSLERWKLLVSLEVLQPHLLTNGQKIEIVLERGHRGAYGTTDNHGALHVSTDGLLKRISFDVRHLGHVK